MLIAELIANEAMTLSQTAGWLSPFAKAAHQSHFDYMGGKVDDITVIVA